MPRLDDAQRRDWLRLIRTENIGPRSFRSLIDRFGSAAAAIEALPSLARRGGGLIAPRVPDAREADAEIAALARLGGRFIGLDEPDYPPALRETEGAPPLIAVRGRIDMLTRPMVAVVGARNASGAGRMMAAKLSRELGRTGLIIASGLARGIDAAAHEAGLDTGTLAALAGGHDRPYPPENLPLLEQILERGVVITEMPLGWVPRARDFPRRNRLVSGVSLAVLVVEAAERSGSLITARLAGEQGRDVFAVPGSPLDPRAAGTNQLIKQGAGLVTSAADILDALGPLIERAPAAFKEPPAPFAAEEPTESVRTRILGLLGPTPLAVDDLAELAQASASDVQIVLLELDIAGRLERHPGGLVSLL
jgi:DNA processing protein